MPEIIDIVLKVMLYLSYIIVLIVMIFLILNKRFYFGEEILLIKEGRYSEAIEELLESIKKRPNWWRLYYNLGYCYYMLGQNSNAIKNCMNSKKLKNQIAKIYILLALLYIDEEHDFNTAFTYIHKVDELQKQKNWDPFHIPRYILYDLKAWYFFNTGNQMEALKYCNYLFKYWNRKLKRNSKKLKEKDSAFLYRLAMISKINGNYQSIKKFFEYSYKTSPNSIFAERSKEELDQIKNNL